MGVGIRVSERLTTLVVKLIQLTSDGAMFGQVHLTGIARWWHHPIRPLDATWIKWQFPWTKWFCKCRRLDLTAQRNKILIAA